MSNDLSWDLLKNYWYDFFLMKFKNNPLFKPLFFTYYLTLNCNFNCSYCGFAREGVNKQPCNKLNTEKTIEVLKIIRKECPNIYFTGGEPLIRPDLIEILKACKKLKFKSISINTNMGLMHKNMEILDYVDNLVASFDMLDEEKYADILGVSEKTAMQVKENIINCAKLQKEKNFIMTINCVILKETIPHVKDLINFCFKNNIRFAVVPAELDSGKVNQDLKDSEEYKSLIKYLLELKKRNKLIFGTNNWLNTILDFKRFDCYPTLTPHVYPNGDLFYPCQPLNKIATNLLETGSYRKALEMGIDKYGVLPMCKDRCHKACYVDPPNFIRNPFLVIKEFL